MRIVIFYLFLILTKLLNLSSLIKKNNKTMEMHNESFENDIAFWLYSSGSTGSPKGTLHMHKVWWRQLLTMQNKFLR